MKEVQNMSNDQLKAEKAQLGDQIGAESVKMMREVKGPHVDRWQAITDELEGRGSIPRDAWGTRHHARH